MKLPLLTFIKDSRTPVVFDGAMGTSLLPLINEIGSFPEICNILYPEDVCSLHKRYIDSGARIIETNTFQGNGYGVSLCPPFSLRGFCSGDSSVQDQLSAYCINLRGAQIARKAVLESSKEAIVGGSVGQIWVPRGVPSGASRSAGFHDSVSSGQFDVYDPQVRRGLYREQVKGLVDGGVDCIILETLFDLSEAMLMALVVEEFSVEYIVSFTFSQSGDGSFSTPSGHALKEVLKAFRERPNSLIGGNCFNGISLAMDFSRRFKTFRRSLFSFSLTVEPLSREGIQLIMMNSGSLETL